jgi:hypothetical protein
MHKQEEAMEKMRRQRRTSTIVMGKQRQTYEDIQSPITASRQGQVRCICMKQKKYFLKQQTRNTARKKKQKRRDSTLYR